MRQYLDAMARRKRALAQCHAARADMDDAVSQAIGVYQARPLPLLAGAAATGFLLARFNAGDAFVRTGMTIAAGPGWRLARQLLSGYP